MSWTVGDTVAFGAVPIKPVSEVDTYSDNSYSTPKTTYSIGDTVYAKAINLNTGSLYDFKYFKTGEGSPRWTEAMVDEDPSNQWRSGTCLLESGWPTGDWEVRVFETGTSTLVCSCGFTVQAVPEFPYGAMAALVTCSAIYLAKRKTLERKGEESWDSGS